MVRGRLSTTFVVGCLLGLGVILSACGGSQSSSTSKTSVDAGVNVKREVNLYTSRHYEQDDVLYERFTQQTGIKVNVIKGEGPELIERLVREQSAPSADVFLTADAGMLHRAKVAGVFMPMDAKEIEPNVPGAWRDPDWHWVAVTKRARVIVYAKDRMKAEELPKTYAELADPKWKKRILIRSSGNVYNQSLVASFLTLWGRERTLAWAKGIVANMARDPKGGDRDQAKALIAGEGDIAVMNTYYVGQMLRSADPEEKKVAEQLAIVFPDQDTTGAHVNVSGIGRVKGGKNVAEAQALIAFLTGKEAQQQFASNNDEYPIHPDIQPSQLLQSWGAFREQSVGVAALGEQNAESTAILIESGWK